VEFAYLQLVHPQVPVTLCLQSILVEVVLERYGKYPFISRREMIVFGVDLCFTADVLFFYLFQCEIFKLCFPISMKFCTVISSGPNFIMLVQNFGGFLSKKLEARNMQNLMWFWMTSNFNGEYLQIG